MKALLRYLVPLACAVLPWSPAMAQEQSGTVRVVLHEPRDPTLDAERSAPFRDALGTALAARVPAFAGRDVAVALVTDPAAARRAVGDASLAIVPVGFWLAELRPRADDPDARPAWPVATVPRFGQRGERFRLVTTTGPAAPRSIDALAGRRVAMQGAVDAAWLRRVVFPDIDPPSLPFEVVGVRNLADEVFAMLEPDAGEPAPDALLLDSAQWQFFQDDPELASKLRAVWTSAPLPRDLVVAIGSEWTDADRDALTAALTALGDDDGGAALLKQMRSDGLEPIDPGQLAALAKFYDQRAAREDLGGRDVAPIEPGTGKDR